MKFVTVFFDLEGWSEVPFRRHSDEGKNVNRILKILDRERVKAVFNTCGSVIEGFPDVMEKIHKKGHEIASHGYAHENFVQLEQTGDLEKVLAKTEKLIEGVTGKKPVGIRSPWILYNQKIYSILEKRCYKWVSNRNVFRTELLKHPSTYSGPAFIKRLFFGMFWITYKKEPFKTNRLLEIPLLSSEDGELLGLVDPEQKSPEVCLEFAYQTLKRQFDKSGRFFNLNFHPWLIGSSNRSVVLRKILDYMKRREVKFVLAKDLLNYYS